MAYTSDLRFKNFIKDIHFDIINRIKSHNLNKIPKLRIFEESYEDSIIYREGGLTFDDPISGMKFGSNDAGWFLDDKPLVIIEGTYGTERGQFGDGQLNRFSHSTGVAMNGFDGLTLIPFKGESYSKSLDVSNTFKTNLKYANIHKGFIKGALEVSKREKGNMFVIDIYNRELIINFITHLFLKALNKENEYSLYKNKIIDLMSVEINNYNYGERSKGFLNRIYDSKKNILSEFSRYYTHNFASLTTSSARDGHGLFGKNLIESYLSSDNEYYSIFIRLEQSEINQLKERNQKEFSYILKSKHIKVKCFDDLIFKNTSLKKDVKAIKNINLFQNRNDELMKLIKFAFENKEILIN